MAVTNPLQYLVNGVIENTPIGQTTPAAGTFTTLTATGQTSLGGAAGAEALRVLNTASAVNYVQAQGSASALAQLSAQGSGTNVLFQMSSKGTSGIEFKTNNFNQTQFFVSHTASAVNYVQVTGAATTANPTISAQGSDTNSSLWLVGKNAGQVVSRSWFQAAQASANYWQLAGGSTGQAPVFSALGSDTNISQVFQPKGTGAIDLAAGSSGVNISNGGTVTALTRTAAGSGYTSFPSVVISSPTTAGGVQATASVSQMVQFGTSPTIVNGGTGYTVGDVLTVVGGTPFSAAATMTVTSVSAGVITGINYTNYSVYTALPSNPFNVTGGTGSGATFSSTWSVQALTITNAGSGYVEQPTVSFSGGGGSGAAAYATVGSGTVVRGLGSTMDFYSPQGQAFRVEATTSAGANYWRAQGAAVTPSLLTSGANGIIGTGGAGVIQFITNSSTEQLRVAHTASAVNYVQVTGAATGVFPAMSAQGSDSAIGLNLYAKGAARINFFNNNGANRHLSIGGNGTAAVNYLDLNGNTATNAPSVAVAGTDTNIDLALTPKGTGVVQFGTYTASILTPTGYITIKDSGGTTRRVLIG